LRCAGHSQGFCGQIHEGLRLCRWLLSELHKLRTTTKDSWTVLGRKLDDQPKDQISF
jgi:hypothetical protein